MIQEIPFSRRVSINPERISFTIFLSRSRSYPAALDCTERSSRRRPQGQERGCPQSSWRMVGAASPPGSEIKFQGKLNLALRALEGDRRTGGANGCHARGARGRPALANVSRPPVVVSTRASRSAGGARRRVRSARPFAGRVAWTVAASRSLSAEGARRARFEGLRRATSYSAASCRATSLFAG